MEDLLRMCLVVFGAIAIAWIFQPALVALFTSGAAKTKPQMGMGTTSLVSVRRENRAAKGNPDRWVGLQSAFYWQCPNCNLDRFVRPIGAVVQHVSQASVDARDDDGRYLFGVMVGENLAMIAAAAPSKVKCPHCHRVYEADIPEAHLLENAAKLRAKLVAPPEDSAGENSIAELG